MHLRVFWSPDCNVELLAFAYWEGANAIQDWCRENEIEFRQFNILQLGLKIDQTQPNCSFRFTNRMDAELCFLRFTDGTQYKSK